MIDYGEFDALIVVDVQNDFADVAGSLFVAGANDALGAINREIQRAHDAGALVVYTQDWHPPVTPHFERDGGIWPVHCVAGTWGAELHPDLIVAGPVIQKGTGGEDGYSGFTVRDPLTGQSKQTPLSDLLHEQRIRHVTIVGLATDYCVKETALDAVRLGFDATVLLDAIRAVDLRAGDGARALDDMRLAGVRVEARPRRAKRSA